MIGHFENNGKSFVVDTPKTPRNWTNRLFNDYYLLELSQTMQGSSKDITDYVLKEWAKPERHYYVLDKKTGKYFCPLYAPLHSKLDSFRSEYTLWSQSVTAECDGIRTKITAFVPVEGLQEIWTVEVENISDQARELALFSVNTFIGEHYMGTYAKYNEECNFIYQHVFPGHAKYEDYEPLSKVNHMTYMYCDTPISSYDTNKYRFYGSDDNTDVPAALLNGKCSNTITQGEEGIVGAMQHDMSLAPNEKFVVNFVIGPAVSVEDIKSRIKISIDEEREKVQALWNKRCQNVQFHTGDETLDYLTNYWYKKQVTHLSRSNRFVWATPVRNDLQDAMGYALVEPEEALKKLFTIMQWQNQSGYLKQWRMHNGAPASGLSAMKLTDGPIWLIVCSVEMISNIIGNPDLYDTKLPYCDGGEDTIYEHLVKAAKYMYANRGEHGLCLMGDGDWTDPMNAPGRLGKGESVWNTMSLVYGIRKLVEVKPNAELENIIKDLSEATNKHAWDGEWYLAAIDDQGRPVGTAADEEGQLFLNTQTWAVISKIASGERLKKVEESIKKLETDFGYVLLQPSFSTWNEKWGRISVKQQGSMENGAVYCHGTLFKALGDFENGNYEECFKTIQKCLPVNPLNPNEVNMQLPLYIANYYFSLKNENYGRSSCQYLTGTVAWVLVLLYRLQNLKK